MRKIPQELLTAIRENDPNLIVVDLRDYFLTDADIQLLCEAMVTNDTVYGIEMLMPNPTQSQLTPISARRLANLRIDELSLNNIDFGDEGAAFLAQSPHITRLALYRCGLTLHGIRHFLQNTVLEMFLFDIEDANSDELSKLQRELFYHMELNKRNTENYENAQKHWQEFAMAAINKDSLVELIPIVPHLRHGVNTPLEYGCTLIQYCVDKNSVACARYLLESGAVIEPHVFEYTPLFTAAENGKFELVQLLLAYGANLTGEFYFNQEEALSIAAAKLCACVNTLLESFPEFQKFLSTSEATEVTRWREQWRALTQHDNATDQINGERTESGRFALTGKLRFFADQLAQIKGREPRVLDFTQEKSTAFWLHISERPELKYGLAMNTISVLRYVQRYFSSRKNSPKLLAKATIYAKIYLIVRKKEFIIKPSMDNRISLDDYSDAKKYCATHFKISVPFVDKPTEQLTEDTLKQSLERLNQEIREHGYSAINWQSHPQLFVATFRGMHYSPSYFSDDQRQDHATTCHLNRFAPAPAVMMMAGHYPRQQQTARESVLLHNRYQLIDVFNEFENSGPTEQYGRQFLNESDALQHRMSDQYNLYLQDIDTQATQATRILYDLNALGYPHYGASDLPYDAALYGFGFKGYQNAIYGENAAQTAQVLDPKYDQQGKPACNILGKIYISLFTPESLQRHHMRDLVGMHNDGRVGVREFIIVERERSVPGGIMQNCMFYESCLMVPDFSKEYDFTVAYSFGLSKERYMFYKSQLASAKSPKEKYIIVKNSLFQEIAKHLAAGLIKMAMDEARQRGGYLVFAHADGTFALRPQVIHLKDPKLNRSLVNREYEIFKATQQYQFRGPDEKTVSVLSQPWQYRTKLFGSATGTVRTNVRARFHNREIQFDIFKTEGDGSCGFYSLPIPFDRAGVVNLLLQNSNNPAVRALTANEIMELTLTQSIPQQLMQKDDVFRRYFQFMLTTDHSRTQLLSSILDHLGRNRFPANDFDSILRCIRAEPNLTAEENECLQRLLDFDANFTADISKFIEVFSSEQIFCNFVKIYIGGNGWLSFARAGVDFERSASVLDAILLVMQPAIRLYIWQDDPEQPNHLMLVYQGGPENGAPTHIHHVRGQATHYSLMAESYEYLPDHAATEPDFKRARKSSTEEIEDEEAVPASMLHL